ncbi:MAG: hypothetical protein WB699_00840 [Bacteroidota bacterium]
MPNEAGEKKEISFGSKRTLLGLLSLAVIAIALLLLIRFFFL